MEIYIEDTIFVNFLTSFIICNLTLKMLKLKFVRLRFWLCIVASIIISVLSAYIKLPKILSLFLKIVFGLILSLILCPQRNIKIRITCFLTFLMNTFLMGGVCYAIIALNGNNINLNQSQNNITVGIVLLGSIITHFVLTKLIKVFYAKKHINNYCYSVKLTINSITKEVVGFLDTGNNIKHNNIPISIIPLELAIKFDKSLNIISLLSQNKVLFKDSCYIKYTTVSGQGTMLIFKPDNMQIKIANNYFDFSNTYIGISLKEISSSKSYSILLNSQLI